MKNSQIAQIALSIASCFALVASPNPIRSQSEVKFRPIFDSSIILVPVVLNGRGPFEFIVDTGADDVILDASLARRLSLPLSGSVRHATIAGAWESNQSVAESLQLGSVRIQNIPMLLANFESVRSNVPGAQGILGQGFLSHFNYLLDYKKRSIRFEQRDEIQNSIRGEPLPCSHDGHRMIVYAQVGATGSHAVRLLLDSGATTLVLSRASAEASRVVLDAARVEITVNTKVALPSGRIPQIMVGLRRFRNLPVAISSVQQLQQICDGLLPASLFRALYVNNTKGFVEVVDSAR
jgi:predicted aspartyl protease